MERQWIAFWTIFVIITASIFFPIPILHTFFASLFTFECNYENEFGGSFGTCECKGLTLDTSMDQRIMDATTSRGCFGYVKEKKCYIGNKQTEEILLSRGKPVPPEIKVTEINCS